VKSVFKKLLLLFVVGAFVSIQQTSAESTIVADEDFSLHNLVYISPALFDGSEGTFQSQASDTTEAFEIELEEEEGPGLYKEIAMFVIIAAVVGYLVIELIRPDEEEEADTGTGGKDVASPAYGFSIDVNW
jgi:hypothetical protein